MAVYAFFTIVGIVYSIVGVVFYHKGCEKGYKSGRHDGYGIGYRNGYDTGYVMAGLGIENDNKESEEVTVENDNKESEEVTVEYYTNYDPITMRHTVKEVFRKDGEVLYTRE